MMRKFSVLFFLCGLLGYSPLVFATGAYIVDDGDIVEKDVVQVENWYNYGSGGGQILVVNPNYQIFENAEFAVQETYYKVDVEQNTLWPQIKYLFHKKEHAGKLVSSSAVFGINYRSNQGAGIYGSYFYLPTTIVMDKFLTLNFNLGAQRFVNFGNNTTFAIGGASAEFSLTPKSLLLVEIFRNSGNHNLKIGNQFSSKLVTGAQIGVRNFYSKNIIFDVIYGKDILGTTNSNWITGGITLLF